jgi:hypothetical protein
VEPTICVSFAKEGKTQVVWAERDFKIGRPFSLFKNKKTFNNLVWIFKMDGGMWPFNYSKLKYL